MKLGWSVRAETRLVEIEDHIAEENPVAAERLIERLLARAEALRAHPDLGKVVPEFPRGKLRQLVEGNYRIVYTRRQGAVEIVTVFHGRRRFPLDEL